MPLEHRGQRIDTWVLGRLRPGVDSVAAVAELQTVAQRLEAAYPETNTDWSALVAPLRQIVIDPFGRKFKLREIQAAYVPNKNKLDFSLKCKSNLWEQIDISGSLDPSSFEGLGHVQLSRFRPQWLIAYLFPESELKVSETRANVTIDFTSDGSGAIKADVKSAFPILELNYGKETLTVKGSRVQGTLEVDEK